MYTLSSQPFYDNISESYRNIFVVDRKPIGPFGNIVKQITSPKLSPFISNNNSCCNCKCIYAIYDPEDRSQFLCIENIGSLFGFLTSKGYTIDTMLTTMMQSSQVMFKKNFVCFIRKID